MHNPLPTIPHPSPQLQATVAKGRFETYQERAQARGGSCTRLHVSLLSSPLPPGREHRESVSAGGVHRFPPTDHSPPPPPRFVNCGPAGESASPLTPREFTTQNSNTIPIVRLPSEHPHLLRPLPLPAPTCHLPLFLLSSPRNTLVSRGTLSFKAAIGTCQVHLSPALQEDRPRKAREPGSKRYFKCCPGGIPFALRRKRE